MDPSEELILNAADRILILAPHPDDETIATGGVIQKAVALGVPIQVVYLTYGDNAETAFIAYRKRPVVGGKSVQQMGLVRYDEALAATATLGLRSDQVTFLGYPDFRTLVIWADHWGDCPPCMSMFTRTDAVPYPNALRPGAPYRAAEILADVEQQLRQFRPTKVFVAHPADHNPDHLSLYLFTRIALWNLGDELQPSLHPFLVHHPAWPEPSGLNPGLTLEPPARLEKDARWWIHHVTPAEVERKVLALQKHQTQYRMSAGYLNSFMRANELFGDLPQPTLRAGSESFALGGGQQAASGIPSKLTIAERAKWVGVERRAVWLEDGCVVVSVEFSRPLGSEVSAHMYVFGYRRDRPFAEMPKLQVRLTDFGYTLKDGLRKLPKSWVGFSRRTNGFLLRVPLELAGDPRWIMGSVRTYAGKFPLDWIAWRIMQVPEEVAHSR